MCGPDVHLRERDFEPLTEAILDAFRDLETLANALRPYLRNIRNVVGGATNFENQVPQLIDDVDRKGSPATKKLLRAIRWVRPDNPKIRAFLEKRLEISVSCGALKELAEILSGHEMEDLQSLAHRAVPPACSLDAESVMELLQALAEHPRTQRPHPLLVFVASVATEAPRDEGLRRSLKGWLQRTFVGWDAADVRPFLARLEEPDWKSRAVRVVCFYAAEDWPRLDDLSWLRPLEDAGPIHVWGTGPVPPNSGDAEVAERVATADLFLLFVSERFISSGALEATLAHVRAARGRIFPIRLGSCRLEHTQLAPYVVHPTSGKPIGDHADRAAAWAEILVHLRAITDRHPRRWRPVKVFCSFHRDDADWVRRLEQTLFPPPDGIPVRFVYDAEWPRGNTRRAALWQESDPPEISMVFLSSDYVDSDDLYREELGWLRARIRREGGLLLPIGVRDVNLADTPLAGLQSLPRGGTPLSRCAMDGEAGHQFFEELRTAIELVARSPAAARPAGAHPQEADRAVAARAKAHVALVSAASDAPHREALKRHLASLRQTGAIDILSVSGMEARSGPPGGASIVVVLCSEALRSELPDAEWAAWKSAARVVPIVLDDCESMPVELRLLARLPEDDSSVRTWEHADEGWMEISKKIELLVSRQTHAARADGGEPSLFICSAGRNGAVQRRLVKEIDSGGLHLAAPLPGGDLLEPPRAARLNVLLASKELFESAADSSVRKQLDLALERHRTGEAITCVVRVDRTPLPASMGSLPVLPAAEGALYEPLRDVGPPSQQREDRWWTSLACEIREITKLIHLLGRPAAA